MLLMFRVCFKVCRQEDPGDRWTFTDYIQAHGHQDAINRYRDVWGPYYVLLDLISCEEVHDIRYAASCSV